MGAKDIVTKNYIKRPEIFADIFNYQLYQGKKKILPEQLEEMDHTENYIQLNATGEDKIGEILALEKQRDVKKLYTAERYRCLVFGVEEQSKVHYAMPVRNFVYDAMEYEKQYQEIRRKHQRDKDYKGHTREEFISGFYKEDSIIPVITVILYFGDEWDGPRSLKEMMKWYGEEAEQYIQDYKLNLIIPFEMEDEDIEKLESSLREVFYFLKYSKDGEKLEEVIKKDDRFRCMETEAAIVVKTLTNMELSIKQEEENVNMCEAIEQIKQKATEIALEDGKRIGLEDGKRIGLEDGKRMIITTMYKKGYSALQIADMTDIDAKSVEEILVSQG